MTRREPIDIAIYNGQSLLGYVRTKGGAFAAWTADGEALGEFATEKAAAHAIFMATQRCANG